jgi:serine/threonine protein kinase
VQRVIGEGGMGTVYLAEHVVLASASPTRSAPRVLQREDLVRRFSRAVAASQIGRKHRYVDDFGRTP